MVVLIDPAKSGCARGTCAARESTKSGAIREFFEETGNRALAPMKRVHDKNGVSLYETRVVPGSKSGG